MSPERIIRVILVHPNRLVREGLAFVLARQQGISVVGSIAQIKEVIDELPNLRPDVYIIDLCAPNRRGLEDARAIRSRFPEAKILVTGLAEQESDVLACAEAGAGGFLPEEASLNDLFDNVRAVASGEAICSPRIAGILLLRVAQAAREREQRRTLELPRVTRREHEIISLIDAGLSNKEIAVRLSIEVQTVKNHVHNVLEKLHLDGRRELCRYIKERGLHDQLPRY
jgi:DNA-binding NarL/FixJ family response regulator